ncbi:polyphosphate kinase 2 family protein [Rheinheimera sp.]|uniref:polyphosphate kinase 2 family protein n=1 Tax=Rheinheimera sp. TaxID=1869214 RepID=UPI003AF97AC4
MGNLDKKQQLAELQHQLARIQQACGRHQRAVVVVLEGADAAGKGGLIRRLGWCLDPRWLHVWSTSAPDQREQRQHWLQRFWQKIPDYGHWAVFDRSWYGRVLVERVEGFASPDAWQRAYQQINQFEQSLTDEGIVLVKIWLDLSPEVQLERLRERYLNPAKNWKLTSEDLRNRAAHPHYQQALHDMLHYTSQATAPWHVLDANDKHQLRLDAFRLLIQETSKELDTSLPPLPEDISRFFQHN